MVKTMFKDLKNKVAILTGGSGFLGMQFAEHACTRRLHSYKFRY